MERVLIGNRLTASVIPVMLAILGTLIVNLPLSPLGGIVPSPLLGLMVIYFWSLVRPDLMPPFWAFAVGVLEDILSGGPPGAWTVAFVATYAFIDRQRDTFAGLSGFGAIMDLPLRLQLPVQPLISQSQLCTCVLPR
ncbi:MAG: rod shape-determining protein MreD [Rhizomicrobium sp.]